MRPDGQLRGVEPSLGAVTGGDYKVVNGTLEKAKKQSDTAELSLQEKYDKVRYGLGFGSEILYKGDTKGSGFYIGQIRIGDCIQYMDNNYNRSIMARKVEYLYIKRPSNSYHLPIEPTEKRRQVVEYLLSIIPE